MNRSRKQVLSDAIKAEIGAAPADLKSLFTDDITGWSPYVTVSGLAGLADLAALREEAFSNVVITFRGLDEVGNKASRRMASSKPITPGHSGTQRGYRAGNPPDGTSSCPASPWPTSATGKIRSFRTYFDDLSLIAIRN